MFAPLCIGPWDHRFPSESPTVRKNELPYDCMSLSVSKKTLESLGPTDQRYSPVHSIRGVRSDVQWWVTAWSDLVRVKGSLSDNALFQNQTELIGKP